MCGFNGAVDIAEVETVFNSRKGILETLPGRSHADVEAVVADGEDEVLCVDAEFLEYVVRIS